MQTKTISIIFVGMEAIYFILLAIIVIEMSFRPRLLSYKGGCELAYGINKRKYKKLW